MKRAMLAALVMVSAGYAASLPARADEVIRFGLAAEPYAPFSVKDTAGNWTGWEVELRDAVCEEMQAKCEWVEVAWDGIIPALLEKKFDVIWSSMSITDERMKVIAFTDKYYTSPAVWVGAKADARPFDPANPSSLDGAVVGAQGSTTHAAYMEKYFKGHADLKLYDTLDSEEADLKAGRIDLLMASGIQISDWLKSADGSDYEIKVKLPHDDLFGYGDGAGLRKEDTELRERLNTAIKAVRASGKYDEITSKYFDFDIYQ
ncbi:amino acid ABC transporter substrate-binding protein (PAAT family) [Hoeflea marina]|uniref:Amino acid ABC transporter substrate-binding protein (PAAT family) n=1 Tax=Hoeflea marina TaxID=274592 RepID=A0A317PQT4_9HYPH|nr:transporter substrate-binding domain-containing protein [Hoeflea marina]PWW01940.1 amino acid ABC transporter substrate-binding protein (PAAT family) [Hoeflea marina]